MKLYDDMPFLRGETLFGTEGKIYDEDGLSLVGREYIHQDFEHDTGSWVRVRVCKNVSSIRLIGGKCAFFDLKPRKLPNSFVKGYAISWMQETAIIDEKLSRGVRPGDLFYVVVGGPTEAYPSDGPISYGDYLHVASGGEHDSTNLANPCGRVMKADFDQRENVLARAIMNIVGRAMTSRPPGNDPTDRILIQAGR